ncbi:DUF664 domain-containing protein [Rhodobacteraceae bacterium RKSG542]|uniref:DinB family protein n=1 Tax=Pseudovibrio flavus TaxID=2529854 RepID=UPI0012BCCB3A|nr:DinB family protein [Pseudovibrio flavus]MTI16888.1 DUF664 domain-containing protein [Pseudovibrio flavus]
MISQNYVLQMAEYNHWMNGRLLHSCKALSNEQLNADRGAFFKSVMGTFNHLIVGDTNWLIRHASHARQFASLEPLRSRQPYKSLDEKPFATLEPLINERARIDAIILDYASELNDADLLSTLYYQNMRGDEQAKPIGALLMHFFNHQTHHRGQITTLLSQYGIDPGVTDLIALLPDEF